MFSVALWIRKWCDEGTARTSRGEIFSPPRLMSSLRRPVRVRKPSSSRKPWSPVWNQPAHDPDRFQWIGALLGA